MPAIPSSSPTATRVIVVDDDAAVREMLVRVLTESGYTALPAASGRQALELQASTKIDLALVDLAMPGETGWSVLTALRRHDPALPAIIITAWSHQQESARAAGANACFEKPLDFPELLAAIDGALRPRLQPGPGGHRPNAVRTNSSAPVRPPFSS